MAVMCHYSCWRSTISTFEDLHRKMQNREFGYSTVGSSSVTTCPKTSLRKIETYLVKVQVLKGRRSGTSGIVLWLKSSCKDPFIHIKLCSMFLASQKNPDIFEIGGIVPTMVQGPPNHPKWFGIWYWPWTQPPKYSLVGLIMIISNFGWKLYPKDSQDICAPISMLYGALTSWLFWLISKGVGRLEVKFSGKSTIWLPGKKVKRTYRPSLVPMSTWETPQKIKARDFHGCTSSSSSGPTLFLSKIGSVQTYTFYGVPYHRLMACLLTKPRKSKDQTLPSGSRESFTWIILKTILCLVLDLPGKCF